VAQLAVPAKARQELQHAEKAIKLSKVAEAKRFLQNALARWPRFADALMLRALIERDQHSLELALADAENAVAYDPNYGKAYIVLGSIYTNLNRCGDAVRSVDHGIEIAPTYWQGHYEMSRALLCTGDFSGALLHANKASAMGSNRYPAVHLMKGYAYLGLKNDTAAKTELETYINLEPNDEARSRAKQILAQLHDPVAQH
jgi:tetratricopeptide (TPR) repeat protein